MSLKLVRKILTKQVTSKTITVVVIHSVSSTPIIKSNVDSMNIIVTDKFVSTVDTEPPASKLFDTFHPNKEKNGFLVMARNPSPFMTKSIKSKRLRLIPPSFFSTVGILFCYLGLVNVMCVNMFRVEANISPLNTNTTFQQNITSAIDFVPVQFGKDAYSGSINTTLTSAFPSILRSSISDSDSEKQTRVLFVTTVYGYNWTDGTNKVFNCPAGQPLINLSGRAGTAIDQLTGKCSDNTMLGPFGGTAGGIVSATDCPSGYRGGSIRYEGIVDRISLKCGSMYGTPIGPYWARSQEAIFNCPSGWKISGFGGNEGIIGELIVVRNIFMMCSSPTLDSSMRPTRSPTKKPTAMPTQIRIDFTTLKPSPMKPSLQPTSVRLWKPSLQPKFVETQKPTLQPTIFQTPPSISKIIFYSVGGILAAFIVVMVSFYRFCGSKRRHDSFLKNGRNIILTAVNSSNSSSLGEIPLPYLDRITDEWSNLLGRGGFGSVYKGVDKGAHIEVAIKKLRNDRRSTQDTIQFKEEINRLHTIRHPNIIRILGTCFEAGFYCMVLELAAGGSVQTILWLNSTRKLFSPSSRLYVAKCLVTAIRHLHYKNILHRDIKPDNICMRYENWYDNPHAMLIDFGISTNIRDEQRLSFTMSSNPGTKYFMAPEYAEKFHFDAKSDVFSIGVSLICTLTADYFSIATAADCNPIDLIQNTDQLGGAWPEDILYEFATLISRCTASKPCDRPSVEELLEGLTSLRQKHGAAERLPLDVSRRITTHSSAALHTQNMSAVDKPMSCVLCGHENQVGVVCRNRHFTCSHDTCLEVLARGHYGSEMILCPGICCSESFYVRDLFGKINADVYGELVLAVDRNNEYRYFVDALKWKLVSLKNILHFLFEKYELIATKLDDADTNQFSRKKLDEILTIKLLASGIEQEEHRLQFERDSVKSRLKYGIACGAIDGSQDELDRIVEELEKLRLQDAGDINLLCHGRIQCPPLFVLVPEVTSPFMKKSRFHLHTTYQMFFLCSHDYSWVDSPIVLKQPKAWFCKIEPLLKWSIFILRLLVAVKSEKELVISRPKNIQDIISSTWLSKDSLMEDVLDHMEYLLNLFGDGLEDLKKRLEVCFTLPDTVKLVHDLRMAIPCQVYGTILVQAYKPGNLGWLDHMELVQNESECSWVRKGNAKAWKRARVQRSKLLVQSHNGDDFVHGKVQLQSV